MLRVKLIAAVTFATIGLAACGSDDVEDVRPIATKTPGSPSPENSMSAPVSGTPILIEQRITDAKLHAGVVVGASVFGESAFCPGGKSSGGSEGAAITETFQCSDGTLEVRFSPTQRSLVQGAPWEVVSGTGSFEGLRGGGSMIGKFDEKNPDVGRVIFVGTVGR